tara:strand:- start:569 stop:817 length:249 start_codon:yes stop_codon:yes gene_type:complete
VKEPKKFSLTTEKFMLIFNYPSKKSLREAIGEPLVFEETSLFGREYDDNKVLYGSNRPHLTGHKREFFAQVTVKNGLIHKVS